VPEDAPESVRALERELKERLESMQGQNLFDVLGVPPSASRKQVKDAYLVLAKKFHPDRVSSLGYEQLGEPADRLFQRISEAFTTLLDDSQREEYRQIVEDKSLAGGREKAREVLRAEIDFQKGEVFFKKGELDRAEEMFEAAVRGNPEEGEHLAMLAWTRHGKLKRVSKSVKPADREQLKQTLLDALKHSPKCARAHYFLGKLLLEEGKEQDALRSFERAVAIKPNYVEPAREINVMRLRKARRTKATKSSFWERLKGS
jgi:curved DNA-binding protein CbpA